MNLFDDIINKKANRKAFDAFTGFLDELGYPYELLDKGMTKPDVRELFISEFLRGADEGYIPVLLSEGEPLYAHIRELLRAGFDAENALRSVGNGEELLSARFRELEERSPDGDDEEFDKCLLDFVSLDEFSSMFTAFSGRLRLTALIRLPAAQPWETVLRIPIGGRNDSPAPAEMAAVCKYWYEKYGAIPAALTDSTLEFYLPEPVPAALSRQAAREVAAFTGEIHPPMPDGCEGVSVFADELAENHVWQFWWD